MREFNLDLLIGKQVAVNCKTKAEEEEFLKYLNSKNIKWYGGDCIFTYRYYSYNEYKSKTCFTLVYNKMLQYSPIEHFQELKEYKILSLDDLAINIKPKNNFKEYGFEADFEGEIKFIDSFNHHVGICEWSNEMSTTTQDKQTVFWINNRCYLITISGIIRIPSRDLIPIKKEWYKNEDNFKNYKGKLIINRYGNVRKIQNIDLLKVSTSEQNMYHDILKSEE